MSNKPKSKLKLFKLKIPFEESETSARTPEDSDEEVIDKDSNSRCVSVDTILIAPDGRNKKKERFKGKTDLVKFRCTAFEKKLLLVKAKKSGLSLSEYCRRTAFQKEITERLTDEQLEIYRMLMKYHNNFKWIGNMFRKKDPALSKAVYKIADDINNHLKKIL